MAPNPCRRPKLLLTATFVIFSVVFFLFLLPSGHHTPLPTTHHSLHSTYRLLSTSAAAAARHCDGTLYPELCVSTLLSIPGFQTKPLPSIISAAVNTTVNAVIASSRNCSSILHRRLDPLQRLAILDCLELLDTTLDDLRLAVSDLLHSPSSHCRADLSTVLSAAITNQYTCLDGFAFVPQRKSIRPQIEHRIVRISRHVSNALALSKKISSPRYGQ